MDLYTEPPQWRRIGANGALFAQSGGGNVNGSKDQSIANSGLMHALPTGRPLNPSIFLLDVLLHVPTHLDQTAPNLLDERNHLVDLGIARQLELRLAGLCA